MAATAAAVVAEEDTELRDLLVQTLENSGVLNRIKVRPEAGAGPGVSAGPAWTAGVTTVAARRPPPWRGTGAGGHWGRAPAWPPSCPPHRGGRLVRSCGPGGHRGLGAPGPSPAAFRGGGTAGPGGHTGGPQLGPGVRPQRLFLRLGHDPRRESSASSRSLGVGELV